MKQKLATVLAIALCLLFTIQGDAQKKQMTWSTKSTKAKEFADKGANHMMNIEYAQAYNDFQQALQLDPDFTVVLSLMAQLSTGASRQMYSDKAIASSAKKTEGEKLFTTLSKAGRTQAENGKTWADLHQMFPDGGFIAFFYTLSRPTPEEQFTAALEYQSKFPDQPAIHNILGYGYMTVKKDTAAAKAEFEKYVQSYPQGANPYDSFGEFYFNTGDMANAEKYYNMALEKYPFNESSLTKMREIRATKDKAKQ